MNILKGDVLLGSVALAVSMGIVMALALGAGTIPVAAKAMPQPIPIASTTPTIPRAPAATPAADRMASASVVQALSTTFEQVVSKASPAVVHIEIEKELSATPAALFGPEQRFWERGHRGEGDRDRSRDGDQERFYRYFFGPGMGQGEQMMPEPFGPMAPNRMGPVPVGQGSGFIISPDGYIVTNNHVVDNADRLKVTLADGRQFTAKVIGADPDTEIALIKVDAQGLPTLTLGDSENLRVGQWVLAIGSPFGLDHSVTSGIVSARGRGDVGIVDYADFIQTDAAINPGNSGGPLLDMDGNVVGMNTAIVSHTGGNNGVGFAIPVNMIRYITDQLREHGTITRGFLGISIQELTPDLAKWFGVTEGQGILVASVEKGSPADKAGLQRDDLIVEYNGRPVGEVGAFRSHIATTTSGTPLEFTIIRGGQRITKTVDVGSKPAEKVTVAGNKPSEGSHEKLGIAVEELSSDLAQQFGYQGEHGVVVAEVTPDSKADLAGIRPGDLIKEVNKKPVDTPQEFLQALKNGDRNHEALLLIQEGQASRYVALEAA